MVTRLNSATWEEPLAYEQNEKSKTMSKINMVKRVSCNSCSSTRTMRLNNFQNKRVERDVLQFLQFSVDYVRLTNDILFCSCKVYFNYELVVVNKAIVCFRFPTAEIIQFKYIYNLPMSVTLNPVSPRLFSAYFM